MTDGLHVLIVDDNPADRALATRELAGEFPDIRTIEVADATTFETAVERGEFELVITEFRLAWSDGLAVLRELKYRYPEIPVIMFTGAGSEEVAVEAMRVGLDDYVLKGPEHVVGLPVAATSVLERARERQARRQAEEALRSSEAHLRALFASMSDVILVLDRDGRYLEIAPTAPELLYRPAAETLGKTVHELFAPEQADAFLEAVRKALDTCSTVEIEYMLEIRGEDMWFVASISPMLEDSVVWVARDITERKRAEEALRESEEEYRNLVERARDGIIIIQDGVIRFTNPRLAETWGGGIDEIVGTPFSDHIDPDELPKVVELYKRRLAGEDVPPTYETILRRKDGGRVHVELNAGMITHKGRPADLVIVREIAERKEAEAAGTAARRDYRGLFDSTRAGLCRTTPGPKEAFLDVNPAMVEMFEAENREQLLALDPSEIYLDEGQHRIVSDALMSRGYMDEEVCFKTLKGRPMWCRIASRKVTDANGQAFFDSALEDVTERKRAEVALALRVAELARANAELKRFAYVASHDLQEPLRMIVSYLQLIERRYEEKLDADGKEFMGFAVDGASRLQDMISSLLEYSRVESRGDPFATVDGEVLLGQALENLTLAVQENGAEVTHDPLPQVVGDPAQLVQVFQNLIGNAIKFGSEESPRIHVSARRREGEWIFSVRDNGIGLDPEYSERIFVAFQRLGRREYPGTGIGLSICKAIVERHNGRIWVESELGKGATFYFTIPVEGGSR